MYWYLISAMVLLAAPVYVIVTKRGAIAHTNPLITAVVVALLVVCGGVSGLMFALAMVPVTGFSYGLIFLVSLLSGGSVCSMFMKYEDLGRTTSCRIGLAIGLAVSLVVAPIFIPIYVEGRVEVLLDSNSSADRRAEVLEQLGAAAVDPLREELLHENSSADRRRNALEALVQLGDTAVDLLVKTLSDDRWWHRNDAAEALGQLGNKRAVDPLIKALSDDYRWVRDAAAEALGHLGDKRAVDPLIKALADENSDVREHAAGALGQLGDKRAFDPLIKGLADKDAMVRKATAEALGQLGDKRAVDPLIKALSDDKSWVRAGAAKALGQLGQPEWTQYIRGDEDDFHRLGSSEDPRAVVPLIKALSHHNYNVRSSAAGALGQLGDKRALAPLIKALSDNDSYAVREAARAALKKLGYKKVID